MQSWNHPQKSTPTQLPHTPGTKSHLGSAQNPTGLRNSPFSASLILFAVEQGPGSQETQPESDPHLEMYPTWGLLQGQLADIGI